jgi:Uma2 family endonuclease
MSTAERYTPHYTVQDYQSWEGDWELWHGIPVAMTPSPFGKHAKVMFSAAAALKNAIDRADSDATLLGELDWIISSDTVVRPDLLIVCGPEPERHLESPPCVVAEVLSDSTRDRDLNHKRRLYEEHGVAYYLILDPERSELTALRRDAAHQFAAIAVTDGHLTLEICETCVLSIAVDRLFR